MEDFKIALAITCVLVVERAPNNGRRQCLCPQGGFQLPLASPRGSPRWVGGFDLGYFQITAFSMGPRVCKILCVPFKSRVYISHSLLVLPKIRSMASKHSEGSSSSTGPLGWEAQCGTWTTCSLGRAQLFFCLCIAQMGYSSWLYCISTLPTHLSVVPSLYTLLCKICSAILLVFLISSN